MAKRFFSTDIWNEDWYIDMPIEYKLFWFYMLSNCDHAGIFKVNLRSFCGLNRVSLTSNEALKYFNVGKERIVEVRHDLWLIPDFFVFQYGPTLNLNNNVHYGAVNAYKKYNIDLTSIRGLVDLKERTKDKDKDKDKYISSNQKKEKTENGKFSGNFKAQPEELFAQRFAKHDSLKSGGEENS